MGPIVGADAAQLLFDATFFAAAVVGDVDLAGLPAILAALARDNLEIAP